MPSVNWYQTPVSANQSIQIDVWAAPGYPTAVFHNNGGRLIRLGLQPAKATYPRTGPPLDPDLSVRLPPDASVRLGLPDDQGTSGQAWYADCMEPGTTSHLLLITES